MKRRSNVNARFPYLLCPFSFFPLYSPRRRTDSSNRFSPTTRRQDAPIGNLSLDRLRYFPSARRPPLPLRGPLQPRVLIGISGFYGTLGLDNAGDLGYRRSPAIFFADGFENRHESSRKKKNNGEWIERKKMLIGWRLVSREGEWIKGESKKKKEIPWINNKVPQSSRNLMV